MIAQIESPELEQQYAGASADLANKRRNFARIKELFAKGIATQVALNQSETDATISENTVGALETTKATRRCGRRLAAVSPRGSSIRAR